jgi:hypothetical protein
MKKYFIVAIRGVEVTLEKNGGFYSVYVDGRLYKRTANELFAVQAFNEI